MIEVDILIINLIFILFCHSFKYHYLAFICQAEFLKFLEFYLIVDFIFVVIHQQNQSTPIM